MNERIKELANQAGFNPYNYEGANAALFKKFAELIVRECVNSIENTIETDCITDSEKMGCEFAITDLMKHFGVAK